MSDSITLSVYTVDGQVFKEDCFFFKAFSSTGEIGVYPDHKTSVIQLADTDVVVEKEDESLKSFYVASGILSIKNNKATILTDTFLNSDSISEIEEKDKKLAAKEAYMKASTFKEKSDCRKKLLSSSAKLRVLQSI